MISSIVLPWLLVVKLQSPLQPQEEAQWNMRYSSVSPERCEEYAKNMWFKYNLRYQGTSIPLNQLFTTTCSAATKKNEYKWFIKCDPMNNCETRKYMGPRH